MIIVRMVKNVLKVLGAILKILALNALGASVKSTLLFGSLGAIFLAVLYHLHPALNDDVLTISVAALLAVFWAWTRTIVWVSHLSLKRNEADKLSGDPIGQAIIILSIVVLLYLGPTFLISSIVMSLLHLSESAQVAMWISKILGESCAAGFCVLVIAALVKGTQTVTFQRGAIEKIGNVAIPHYLQSFSGLVRQAFR